MNKEETGGPLDEKRASGFLFCMYFVKSTTYMERAQSTLLNRQRT